MEQETNENKIKEPQPVKKKVNKIIKYGVTIALSGSIVVAIGSIIFPHRLCGATVTARLKYEQQKNEIKNAIKEQKINDSKGNPASIENEEIE